MQAAAMRIAGVVQAVVAGCMRRGVTAWAGPVQAGLG